VNLSHKNTVGAAGLKMGGHDNDDDNHQGNAHRREQIAICHGVSKLIGATNTSKTENTDDAKRPRINLE
jgi:hypothetical protein